MQSRYSQRADCRVAAKRQLLLTNRQGEGKTGRVWVLDFDAYFGESALTISTMPKI